MSCRSVVRDVRDSIGSLSRRNFEFRLPGHHRGRSYGSFHEIYDQPLIVQSSRWANLPPELLCDVMKRLEESESTWPARRHVVACASVCKSWRSMCKEIVRSPETCGKLTFPVSLKQPGSRDGTIQCFIKRDKSNLTYHLFLCLSPALLVENGKFLLSAKRTRRTTCTEYVISMDADNISRSSSTYIGKLRRDMARFSEAVNGLKPALAMFAYQAARAGANIFFLTAASDGMSMRVLIAYRFLFAAIFISGLALIIERKNRPKLTWLVVGESFICGLLSCSLSQNLYAQGLVITTGTFASAMYNLVPAFTYILAVFFRLERLGLRTIAGKAKLVGTMVCIGGAMVLTFYKGPELNLWHTNFDLLDKDEHKGGHVSKPLNENVGLGSIMLVCCCISAAMGLIVQAKMVKNYPCTYSGTAMLTAMGAIQSVFFALCMEKSDWSQWKLDRKARLFATTYNGIVATGAAFILATWCIRMKGPLYVSVFNPLMLVLVAIAGSLVLDEKLHMGSVIGAVVIVLGLYLVLWGKAKELTRTAEVVMSSQSSRKTDSGELIMGMSGDVPFVYQESVNGDHLSECDEIKEEGNEGKLKNAESA